MTTNASFPQGLPGLRRVQALAARIDRAGPLPAPLAHARARVAGLVRRLPSAPPSQAAAIAINRWAWPRFPAELREGLCGRIVALEVTDLGLRVRLRADASGLHVAGDRPEADLRIAAQGHGWWRLLRGLDDPDRLFFDRVLVMEGDTELGLLLKNSLDALGPLWPAERS